MQRQFELFAHKNKDNTSRKRECVKIKKKKEFFLVYMEHRHRLAKRKSNPSDSVFSASVI